MGWIRRHCLIFRKEQIPAIAKAFIFTRSIRRTATCFGAGACLVFAGPVAASDQCPAIAAIISGEFKQLEGVGVTINGNGRSDLTKFGTAGIVRDAGDCSLSTDTDGFDIYCDWVFRGGQDSDAENMFLRLKDGLDICLPSPLGKHRPRVYSEAELQEKGREYGEGYVKYLRNTQDLQDYRLRIDTASSDAIDVELKMSRAKDTGRTSITVSFYR